MEVVQTGTRVLLARPHPADEEEFLALIRASADFLRPWEPQPPPGLKQDSPQRFRSLLEQDASDLHDKLLIRRTADRAIIGSMSLNNIVKGVFLNAHLGYWIGGDYARQGYMTEALQLALRHAFVTRGLHRVEANVRPHNVASIALVRRAGFRLEGVGQGLLRIAGDWSDHERWALLSDEWGGASESRPPPSGWRCGRTARPRGRHKSPPGRNPRRAGARAAPSRRRRG
ncbi:MAG: GNAT family N-acetyltransferase [Planctomycetota bacterium]